MDELNKDEVLKTDYEGGHRSSFSIKRGESGFYLVESGN